MPAGAVLRGDHVTAPVGNKYSQFGAVVCVVTAGKPSGTGQRNLMRQSRAEFDDRITGSAGNAGPGAGESATSLPHPGIHLKKDDETKRSATLMNIGRIAAVADADLQDRAPFIVERCWFDGGASDTSQATNGLRIYGNSVGDGQLFGEFRLIGRE